MACAPQSLIIQLQSTSPLVTEGTRKDWPPTCRSRSRSTRPSGRRASGTPS
uniref:Uncharacterized protein n=1 Tax=Arundo donax TaxID=35708 RepID=A0A0A9EEY5_ARUDO